MLAACTLRLDLFHIAEHLPVVLWYTRLYAESAVALAASRVAIRFRV
jgi:hypothetical protein